MERILICLVACLVALLIILVLVPFGCSTQSNIQPTVTLESGLVNGEKDGFVKMPVSIGDVDNSLTITWYDDWWTAGPYCGDGSFPSEKCCNECEEYATFIEHWINDYRDVTTLIPGHRYLIETTLDPKYADVICSGGSHWYSEDCDGDECSVRIEEIWAEITNEDNIHFFVHIYPDVYAHGENFCRDRDESISSAYNKVYATVTNVGVYLKARVGFKLKGFADADLDLDGECIVGEVGLDKLEIRITDLGSG